MVYYTDMPNDSRHGKRADGKSQTSLSMREDLMNRAREEAAKEGRTLSNWIEQMLKEKFPEVAHSAAPPKKRPSKEKQG